MTFKELSNRYLDSVTFAQLEDHSQNMYKHWTGRVPEEATLSPKAMYMWLKALPVRATSKNHCLSVMRTVYGWGVREELIGPSANVTKSLRNFRSTSEKPPGFTKEEVNAVCEVADGPREEICALFLRVLFWTGARPSEILRLKWGDIDYDKDLISIIGAKRREKGTVSRYCNLLPVIVDHLEEIYEGERAQWHGDDTLIFKLPISMGNRPLELRYVRNKVSGMCARVGVKKTLRQVRTGLATAMLRNGYSLTDVQHTLGHKNISTTQKYIRISGQEKAKSFKGL